MLYFQGQLAATKEELIGAGKRENRQIFYTLPTLGELRVLLLVICEEIKTYTVWPVSLYWFLDRWWRIKAFSGKLLVLLLTFARTS